MAMLEKTNERTMGSVIVQCRSYAVRAFDGCPGCVGAALDAIGQAGLYLLGRSAPDLMGGSAEPLKMAYWLNVRLLDEMGMEVAADRLHAEQTIEAVEPPDEFTMSEDAAELDHADDESGVDPTTMRLEDFQTILERVSLAPAGSRSVSGMIAGRLFGFERQIGLFEIEVCPA
jgi:hypothetical protein